VRFYQLTIYLSVNKITCAATSFVSLSCQKNAPAKFSIKSFLL